MDKSNRTDNTSRNDDINCMEDPSCLTLIANTCHANCKDQDVKKRCRPIFDLGLITRGKCVECISDSHCPGRKCNDAAECVDADDAWDFDTR